MQSTRLRLLRYLHGVKATATMGPEHLIDGVLNSDTMMSNRPVSQRFLGARRGSAEATGGGSSAAALLDKSVQLRIGGAQMLSSTANRIYNHNEAHPLFFSQTSPRQAGLCATLVDSLRQLKIRQLTELQGALIPLFLKGKHVIAHAETGTGKSFGIALATANRILRETLNHRLHTIILVPTEELALQYDKWLKHFGGCASQVSQPAVDSIPLESQLAKLHNIQPNVLVGTLQRIADIMQASPTIIGEKLRRRVDCVILDEADVLLSQPVVLNRKRVSGADLVDRIYRQFHEEVPAQMVAISATIDGPTAQRLNGWMRNDKAVRITTSFVEHSIPHTISFYFFAASPLSASGVLHKNHAAVPGSHPLEGTASAAVPIVALGSSVYSLEQSLELVLRLIFRQSKGNAHVQHKRPRILIFTDALDVMEQLERMKSSVLSEWEDHSNVGNGEVSDDSVARASSVDAAASRHRHWRDCGFAGLLHQPPDPSNPNKRIKASELVGRNKEIYVKNNSNMSQLQSSMLLIGVGPFDLSRGMHVGGVTHVIMYGTKEMPSAANFVHCAGRTGRMGKEGDVICIFPPSQGRHMQSVCGSVEIPFHMSRISRVDALLRVRDDFMAGPHSLVETTTSDATAAMDGCGTAHTLLHGDATTSVEHAADGEPLEHSIRDPDLRMRILDQMLFVDEAAVGMGV